MPIGIISPQVYHTEPVSFEQFLRSQLENSIAKGDGDLHHPFDSQLSLCGLISVSSVPLARSSGGCCQRCDVFAESQPVLLERVEMSVFEKKIPLY